MPVASDVIARLKQFSDVAAIGQTYLIQYWLGMTKPCCEEQQHENDVKKKGRSKRSECHVYKI